MLISIDSRQHNDKKFIIKNKTVTTLRIVIQSKK